MLLNPLLSKRILWDYILGLINCWNAETIVLGDFNEVRFKEERFGSSFSHSCARVFNHFISSSGLLDVKMEGYSFTWSHPSATKMSKLDRFLISEGIISAFPSLSAVCLDRDLSDHRPIILNEIHSDFGPTPFRTYHSWFKYDGFDSLVEQAWFSLNHKDSNMLIRFKKKLQDLKKLIRVWIRDTNRYHGGIKNGIITDLADIDKQLDGGEASEVLLLKRNLHKLNQRDLKDVAQKAKVRWAIEGDENTKFFHGIINKKRSQLAIRGVFVNGDWITVPALIKDTVYKVVTKVLARRLAMVISDLISNTQSAFVANRQILDGPFILNEVVFCSSRCSAYWLRSSTAGRLKRSGVMVGVDSPCSSQSSELFSYIISLYKAPVRVLHEMEMLQNKFFNGGSFQDRKITWVAWNKEIVVANKMGASSVSASFRRDVRDGAKRQQWDDLSSIMNSVVLSSSKDRWTCDLSGDGEFKVKVIRNFIDDLFLPSSDVATRWVKFIPIKVNVFSWRARRDRLPTRVNLSRRGVLLDSHLCPLVSAMEDVSMFSFRCDGARVVLS
ncbi:RNA-directed DNA polymerase, eukaryota [Tanacetum coccineum]|uniref:RNA-directed DNA polymerase, eukaryota n=1 Tax=Tanacetum coccineum TaxID=301880 RepID=A0ABQ5G202_9ASTR